MAEKHAEWVHCMRLKIRLWSLGTAFFRERPPLLGYKCKPSNQSVRGLHRRSNGSQEPCLVVPLNLEAGLQLNHGRAFVGFTAGTGKDTWQVREAKFT